MKTTQFPEQTTTFAKDQKQYNELPAHKRPDDIQGCVTCCWKLTWRERLTVLFRGTIWHQVLTFNFPLQPQRLTTEKPDMDTV